jgi:hypothetical protein
MPRSATADPTDPSPGLDFCLRLTRAYATLTRRLDNVLSGLHGLSFGDFMILYHLGRAPGKRLRRIDLAERLGLTASGVTRSLLPLEKLGLVTRQPDPRDATGHWESTAPSGSCCAPAKSPAKSPRPRHRQNGASRAASGCASQTSSRPMVSRSPTSTPCTRRPSGLARFVQPLQGVRHAAKLTVADDQQVGAAPARLVHQFDGPFDGGLHVGAAVEGLAHQRQQRVQAVRCPAQVLLQQFTRPAKGDQLAAAPASCAACSAAMTTALAMSSGAPCIEPEVSRHSMMGPRSSGSGGATSACACGPRVRVHAPVGQHGLHVPAQQARFGMAGAPQLLEHRVAQHHRLAGQHVLDAAARSGCR